jgi:glycosyltransferase involved in cell wall biosynthesis
MIREVRDISYALRSARAVAGPLRLVVFGRGSREAETALRTELGGTNVEVDTLGLLSPEEISRTLARAHVLLFVRGQISSRRGSAIAGIACGLPIVSFASVDTTWPLTEAGLLLAPENDREALSASLAKVLSDAVLHQALSERSRRAQAQYFSWPAIADQFAAAFRESSAPLR